MSLYEQTEAALKGGATMVQLREKGLRDDNVEEYLEEAKKMRALTEKYNVPLLIDDNIKLAKACGADGIHVILSYMDTVCTTKSSQFYIIIDQERNIIFFCKSTHFFRLFQIFFHIVIPQSFFTKLHHGTAAGYLRIRIYPGGSYRRYLPGKY